MATVRYYLRNKSTSSKIWVQLSISRELKLRTSTDLIINHSDWSSDTSMPKQNSSENKILSKQLRDLSNYLLDEFNTDYISGVVFNTEWIKNKINIKFNRLEKVDSVELISDDYMLVYINDHIEFKKSISTTRKDKISKLNNLQFRFEQFQKYKRKKFLIPEVTGRVLIAFRDFLVSDCNFMESTASRMIKDLKTILFDAQSNGKEINHQIKGFSTGSTNSEFKVFLSFQEIESIKKITTINKDWDIAKDWLIIGCFVGQRASDLLRMNIKMIYTKTDSEGNTYRFIELKQQKTGDQVVIPIHDEVEEVLKKYGGEFPPVFGDTSDSNSTLFNRHIKKVCELAGIHDIVKGKVYNEDEKKNEIVNTEKYKLVSTHVCRRSFATNFYGNKLFTTPQLMAITGHKSETQFLNYIGRTADDWAMQTARTFKEISKKNII